MRKYAVAETDTYHVLRAMTWFANAERDAALPRGMDAAKWRELKAWFEDNAGEWVAHDLKRGRPARRRSRT